MSVKDNNKLNLSVDKEFENSEIYPYFGLVNINRQEFSCTVTFLVSSSDDIEIDKVIDFLKDFITSQIEENTGKKYLEIFKIVNKQISEVLSETLEGDSFIDVGLAYVLIKDDYYYVSLDENFNLIIRRGEDFFKVRRANVGVIDGSGILELGDDIELIYQDLSILHWNDTLGIDANNEDTETIQNEEDVENIVNINSLNTQEHIETEKFSDAPSENMEELVPYEESKLLNLDNDENLNLEENMPTESFYKKKGEEIVKKLKPLISIVKEKSQPILQKTKPTIKRSGKNSIKYLGEAFSYVFSFISRRGRKQSGVGKALPNKTKGFLILSLIIFLIILLGLFIKSTNEDNLKKQQEQAYRDQVTKVGNDVTAIVNQYSSKVNIGDSNLKNQITTLTTEIKTISDSPLKDKLNQSTAITNDYQNISVLQDKVDGIIRLGEEIKLAKYSGLVPNFNPSDITYKGGKVYFTDLGNANVSQFDTSTNITSDVISKNTSIVKPQALEFGKNQLLLLDNQNGIFSIDINSKSVNHLVGYDKISPTSTTLKTYFDKDTDNFYLLEPNKKLIDRVPGIGNNKYGSIIKYNKDDLGDNLEDFAIIGGSAYTIDSTGLVKKYTRNNSIGAIEDPFSMPTLTVPIGPGARIVGMTPRDSGNVYLFIADPANSRLLVFDNKSPDTGDKFVAQYKISTTAASEFKDVFKNIKGISLDDTGPIPAIYMILSYGLVKINISL